MYIVCPVCVCVCGGSGVVCILRVFYSAMSALNTNTLVRQSTLSNNILAFSKA